MRRNLEHVGQVVLALGVVAANLADVCGERRAVEGVAAGVALKKRLGLLVGAILLLDDAEHLALVGELDAAIAKGVGRRHGKNGRCGGAVGDRIGKLADGLGLDKRQVAVSTMTGPALTPVASSATLTA